MATPEHQRWTQDRVARELEAWFAQRCFDDWPPYSAFVADRPKRLHAALMRHGGPERWAQELGVAFIVRPPGAQRSEAQIRDSLRVLFREHRPRRFPVRALAARARPARPCRADQAHRRRAALGARAGRPGRAAREMDG